MKLPADHPLRIELNDEVHSRPPDALTSPCRILYVAVLPNSSDRKAEWQHVCDLCRSRGVQAPEPYANHLAVDLGDVYFKWERHTEFTRYNFITRGAGTELFQGPEIPADLRTWMDGILGKTIVAAQVELTASPDRKFNADAISRDFFSANTVVGASLSGGTATGFTDFRVRDDSFSRILVLDHGLAPRQAGRLVQRLLEIDTYRMLALLALPVARSLGIFLNEHEQELAAITSRLTEGGVAEEQALLARLTKLEAAIEGRFAQDYYRFSASKAYYELVQGRITDLREERIAGLQTFREFTERRLAPAMNTCRATATRIEALSERVNRSSQLLTTRVAIEREQQSQGLLEALANRARLQLRLQQTVEGLSIAAITYYVVGLIGYVAKAFKVVLPGIEPELAIGVSVPFVAAGVAYALHQVRKGLEADKDH